MTIGKLLVAGTMVTLATLMTMGLVKTVGDNMYQVKGSTKKFKDVKDLEKELNNLGYKVK